ncbi:MAG TPA: NUDIX domain-containing protein, partial [Limnochordia bacterium]|nr:NUDIX domain-containing protein [Limnochordia bacterium]
SRARNLQAAAKEMVARYDARVPDTPADLASLPGIGPYTAGAVLSIAFNRPTAAVDGNVLRVLARFYADAEPIDRPQAKKRLAAAAADLVDPVRPGDFNQALMELGALVCRPHRPDCQNCPLAWSCAAFATGEPEGYGRKSPKRAVPVHHWAAAFVRREGAWFLCRRAPEGLLGGLWELPAITLTGDDPPEAALIALLRTRFGVAALPGALLAQATHTFSHQRWQMRAYAVACGGEPALQATTQLRPVWLEARWCDVATMAALPLTTLTRRLFAAVDVQLPAGPSGSRTG